MTIEVEYQKALLKALPLTIKSVAFFGRVTGKYELRKGGWVHPSIPGQCDVYGIRKRDARHYELELKNVHTRTSPEQEAWAAWCAENGVPYLLLRVNKGELDAACISRWVAEIARWVSRP